MIRPPLALAALLALAVPAAAEGVWRYLPGQAEAALRGAGPLDLGVGCGNGGMPAPYVGNYTGAAPDPLFVFGIDSRDERLIPGDCAAGVCLLGFDTVEDAQALVSELRQGGIVRIGLYRQGFLAELPLTGSNRAIGGLLADCPFP
jgi:hypothetical protein